MSNAYNNNFLKRIGDEKRLNTVTTGNQSLFKIAKLNDNKFIASWSSYGQDSSAWAVMGQFIDADGNKLGNEFLINTYTNSHQFAVSTKSFNGGKRFIAAWTSYGQDGSGWGVYGQIFDENANKIGSEFRINTYTANDQGWADGVYDWFGMSPIIEILGNGVALIVWASWGQDGSGWGIYGQRFNENGTKVGTEFLISTYVTDNQYTPRPLKLDSNKFIVVWTSDAIDESDMGISGKIFDNDLNIVKDEFRINTYTIGYQWFPSVAKLENDKLMVAWGGNYKDGSGYAISGQIFDGNYNRIGEEMIINTITGGDQAYTTVKPIYNGRFAIVTFGSNVVDGSGYSVQAQLIDSAGQKIGNEIKVNTYSNSDQNFAYPAITSDSSINIIKFMITWMSNGQDGSEWGIYAQNFQANLEQFSVRCNDFLFPVNSNTITLLPFQNNSENSVVNDEDEILKVKFYSLPTCSTILDGKNIPVTTAVNYGANAVFLKACNVSGTETVSFTIIDSDLLESGKCSMSIVTTNSSNLYDPITQGLYTKSTEKPVAIDSVVAPKGSIVAAAGEDKCYNSSVYFLYSKGSVVCNAGEDKCYNSATHSLYSVATQQVASINSVVAPKGTTVCGSEEDKCYKSSTQGLYNSATQQAISKVAIVCPSTTNKCYEPSIEGTYVIATHQVISHDPQICQDNQTICANVHEIYDTSSSELCDKQISKCINNESSYNCPEQQDVTCPESGVGTVIGVITPIGVIGVIGSIISSIYIINLIKARHLIYQYPPQLDDATIARIAAQIAVQYRAAAPAAAPIAIDLDRDGNIEVIKLSDSDIYFNYGAGAVRTSWVGQNDGILAYDHNNNLNIDNSSEIVLTEWATGSKTDFEALLKAFDSNGDKIFNQLDERFNSFYIWRDANQNGVSELGELLSLEEVGLLSIDFHYQEPTDILQQNLGILNTAYVEWSDGATSNAYDMVFYHE